MSLIAVVTIQSGGLFNSQAREFKNRGSARRGGDDLVELQDVAADEMVTGSGSQLQLAARNATLNGFSRVRAFNQGDETAHADLHNIDSLFERIGEWGDI